MEQAVAAVRRISAAGKLSHAYLITGPSGPRREAMAKSLAMAMVCEGEQKPCTLCPHCKKVLAGIHPDVTGITIPEDKREIVVGQIRDVRTDAYVLPNEAARKVFVIDPAGAMNENAQNAFLKVLEEGPAYAAFLLLADAEGQLLPTVRSRCEKITVIPSAVEENRPLSEQAVRLADAMLSGKESLLMEHCVALEKEVEKGGWPDLLEQTALELERRAREDLSRTGVILPMIDHLKKLHSACFFNVGGGHLAGWLCAGVFK